MYHLFAISYNKIHFTQCLKLHPIIPLKLFINNFQNLLKVYFYMNVKICFSFRKLWNVVSSLKIENCLDLVWYAPTESQVVIWRLSVDVKKRLSLCLHSVPIHVLVPKTATRKEMTYLMFFRMSFHSFEKSPSCELVNFIEDRICA